MRALCTVSLSCRQQACSNLKINCDLSVSRPSWAGVIHDPPGRKGIDNCRMQPQCDQPLESGTVGHAHFFHIRIRESARNTILMRRGDRRISDSLSICAPLDAFPSFPPLLREQCASSALPLCPPACLSTRMSVPLCCCCCILLRWATGLRRTSRCRWRVMSARCCRTSSLCRRRLRVRRTSG